MKRLAIIFLFLIPLFIKAQDIDDLGQYKVHIYEPERTIQAEIKPVDGQTHIAADRLYYWYSAGKVKATEGGFSGKLLNGNYSEFYPNKNLKEQGLFLKGLKDKLWKSWADNGMLIQVITWKNGLKNGAYTLYDEKGALNKRGFYKNGLLDGEQVTYINGTAQIVTYDHGNVVPTKSRSFWRKLNIFKKQRPDA